MLLSLAKPTLDVGIAPHDADAMRRFYGDALGFAPQATMPFPGATIHPYAVGTSVLKLYCADTPPPAQAGGIDAAIGYRLLTLILPDLDAAVGRIEAGGGRVDRSTFDAGGTSIPLAFCSDPDGNFLELVGVPGASPSLQVGMTVADLDRTSAFYVDLLGIPADPPLVYGDIERHSVTLGQTTLKYWTRKGDLPVRTGPIADVSGIRYVTAWVTNLDEVAERLTDKGVPLPVPPTDLGAARICIAADPDGNWVELVEAKG